MSGTREAACPHQELVRRLVSRHGEGELSLEEETLLRRHVVACPPCSADAVRQDPTFLFAPLSVSAEAGLRGAHPFEGDDEVEATVTEVLSAIDSRRIRRTGLRFSPLLKAAAVVLLAAGLFLALRPRSGSRTPAAGSPGAPEATAGTPAATELASPLIEGVGNPDARVYQFAASSPQEPNIVFVANPAADL